jgi:ketosteroid isomerase-like protein
MELGLLSEGNKMSSKYFRTFFLICFVVGVLALPSTSSAQSNKKKKDDPNAQSANTSLMSNQPEQDKIDFVISEMLGAWQIGNIDLLHKNIADDVVVVNGMWAPPVIGWTNYLASYQSQRARVQQIRMDRTNTLIRVMGTFASACYQWEFSGVVDGQQTGARGQTTLLLEKRSGNWMIIHNHTSIVENGVPAHTTSVPETQPQPAAAKP